MQRTLEYRQKRERIFIGIRSDLGIRWPFPSRRTQSSLLAAAQWFSEEYWEEHSIATPDSPIVLPSQAAELEGL